MPMGSRTLHQLMDLLRESGEFPMSDEELDDAATTVYEGICGRSGPPGANQRSNAARDRRKVGRASAKAALTTTAAKNAASDIRFVPDIGFMRALNTASAPA